ncbi:MAG: hypothetical protein JW847_04900 [Candidatus Omnitrophica bacterium]|nr:hypothetical protein [Candidatus Omnitrophota bacterium]
MAHDLDVSLSVWASIFSRLATMMFISAAVILYAVLLGAADRKTRPTGVLLFAILLTIGSIYKLWGFLNFDYYRFMFQPLPDQMIIMRYCGSVALRLAGLVIATGVLLLNDLFRKLFIALCVLTLCFIYWKHPLFVFENISRHTEQLFFHKEVAGPLTYPLHCWITLIFNCTVDIVFCGSALYYFTRPKVKEHFH